MSKIPFTVYDFFAYLSSGSVIVAAVDSTFGYHWLLRGDRDPAVTVLLVFLAYVTGHLVAHLSSFILEHVFVDKVLKRPARTLMGETPPRIAGWLFPGYYKTLPAATQERIQKGGQARGGAGSTGEALFLHAYAVVTRSGQAQERLDQFRNLYGFARNMTFAFLAAAVILVLGTWVKGSPASYIWGVLSVGFGIGMLYRYLKFFRQFSYQLFITYAEMRPDEP